MKFSEDHNTVIFKAEPAYHQAVAQGRKTCEVRMMTAAEVDEFRSNNPKFITITDLYGEWPMTFEIVYRTPIATILGTEQWLICFKP